MKMDFLEWYERSKGEKNMASSSGWAMTRSNRGVIDEDDDEEDAILQPLFAMHFQGSINEENRRAHVMLSIPGCTAMLCMHVPCMLYEKQPDRSLIRSFNRFFK